MPMKVTVCFDKLKVLVPCGDGEILVRELIEKAITRYKKAIGKSTDYWVSVHYLRTNDDSILDPDDTLNDVVDDREQLTADFEEQGGPRVPHNGDGQSVSSAGTASPDIFQTGEFNNNNGVVVHGNNRNHYRGFSLDGGNDVIVTATELTSGSGLTVRRGSEPALNVLEDSPPTKPSFTNGSVSETLRVQEKNDVNTSKDHEAHKPIIRSGGPATAKEREKTPPFSRFARDSWRQSLGNQPNMFKWLEAHERQEDKYHKQPERQAPVGGSTSQDENTGESTPAEEAKKPPVPAPTKHKEVGILLCLTNDGTPLGIHVIPDFDQEGRESGLLVQGIEEDGRIFQDGRLKIQDRIIEINGHDLHGITFPKAQEIFRNAMKTPEVRLKVVKHSVPPLPKKPPPAVLPKPRGHSPVKPSPLTLNQQNLDLSSPQTSPDQTSTPLDKNSTPQSGKDSVTSNQSINESVNKLSVNNSGGEKSVNNSSANQSVSPKKRAPPAPPVRAPSTTLSAGGEKSAEEKSEDKTEEDNRSLPGTLTKKREAIIAPTNTKKIGKKVELDLVKGPMGLGFSVTTRDNTTGGPSPIYIKNILPKGAAVTDGRLLAGDRLLNVDDFEMTGKTQTEAVAYLRNIPLGSKVHIIVSRQETEEDELFKIPRELPPERAGDDGTLAVMKNKEIIELNIPLNASESAGLGVSVKGKTITTEEEGTRDLGIFVKAVIHGGAASKDGRLQVNDQLLEVNHSSLINMPNTEAMDILRNAMQEEGPYPGHINIKIARKIGAPSPSPFSSPDGPGQGFEFDEGVKFGGEENNNKIPLDHSDHVTKAGGRVSPIRPKGGGAFSDFKSPNLLLDRIMAGNGLRNESYTKATHESYAETPEPVRPRSNLVDLSKQKPRPHSTLGIERHTPGSNSSSSDEEGGKEPAWIHGPDWSRHPSQTSDDSQLSPTGVDGFSRDGFGRQSMSEKRKGHNDPRSSEVYQRAKGLKDVSKGLQRAVQYSGSYGRLVRAGSAESLLSRSNSNLNSSINARNARDKLNMSRSSTGIQSNLKRFSSLENLTTMHDADVSVSFDDNEDNEDESSPQPRMARRRGGNESFRAAVDRSYDPVPRLDNMDPQQPDDKPSRMQRSLSVEEESSEGGSLGRDPANSARSSVSDAFISSNDPHAKKKDGKKGKEARRSGGRLKGLFKFGFGRKTPVDDIGKSDRPEEHSKDSLDSLDSTGNHRDHVEHQQQMWQQAHTDQERAQEQYRRLQEQHFLDQQRLRGHQPGQTGQPVGQPVGQQQQAFNHFPYKPPEPHNMGLSAPVIGTRDTNKDQAGGLSRAEKIQQLRADHQRRHQERQGHYPHEDQEEEYEKQIQEDERKKYGQSAIPSQLEGGPHGQGQSQGQGQVPRPGSRNQMERPGSRVGAGDVAGPGTGNYQDYSDLAHPPGARHVSDSNIRYTHNRPPSRGHQVLPDYPHHYPLAQYPPPTHHTQPQYGSTPTQDPRGPTHDPRAQQQRGPTPTQDPRSQQRGPTPTHDHRVQQHGGVGIARGPTPVHDQDRNINLNYPVKTNYQQVQNRGPTPTNENWYSGDPQRRQYTSQSNFRYGEHLTRQDGTPHPGGGGGNYGVSSSNYREPAYNAMAGRRPVKSLSSQPNSAKV